MFALGVLLFAIKKNNYPWSSAQQSDASFRLIVNNQNDLFWQAHAAHIGQEDFFDPEFCDLVNNLFCIDFEQRFDIDQALEHPWMMREEALDQDAFKNSMTARYVELHKSEMHQPPPNFSQNTNFTSEKVYMSFDEAQDSEIPFDDQVILKISNPQTRSNKAVLTGLSPGQIAGFLEHHFDRRSMEFEKQGPKYNYLRTIEDWDEETEEDYIREHVRINCAIKRAAEYDNCSVIEFRKIEGSPMLFNDEFLEIRDRLTQD